MKKSLSDFVKSQLSENAAIIEGFDDCAVAIGLNSSFCKVLIYDVEKMISSMMVEWNLSREAAEEYFSTQIAGMYLGDGSPIFLESYIKNSCIEMQPL